MEIRDRGGHAVQNHSQRSQSQPGQGAAKQLDALVDKLKERMRLFEIDIERLETKTAAVSTDLRTEYEHTLISLRKRSEELRQRLAEFEHSGKGAWAGARPKIEQAMTSLAEAVEIAKNRLTGH
jgi:hypothetical protein